LFKCSVFPILRLSQLSVNADDDSPANAHQAARRFEHPGRIGCKLPRELLDVSVADPQLPSDRTARASRFLPDEPLPSETSNDARLFLAAPWSRRSPVSPSFLKIPARGFCGRHTRGILEELPAQGYTLLKDLATLARLHWQIISVPLEYFLRYWNASGCKQVHDPEFVLGQNTAFVF
jgi:hypothetical protein